MSSLSVLILTKNEEINIAEAIRSARQCTDDIIVVDSGSTDGTVAIAKSLGARVCFRAWDGDFAAQSNFSALQSDAQWVLFMDADERISPELARAITEAVAGAPDHQYEIERRTVAFDTTFRHGVLSPDHVRRLFPRTQVSWVNKVHERPVCSLPVKRLAGYLEHYTYRSWEDWERKQSLYSTIWARDAHESGRTSSVANAFAHSGLGFLKMFLLKQGFRDGRMGMSLAAMYSYYTLMKYLKLHELNRTDGKDGDSGS